MAKKLKVKVKKFVESIQLDKKPKKKKASKPKKKN